MAENFQDNITYGGSTLAVSGDAVIIGSTNAGAKSVIYNNTGNQGHLAWQPTANRTINLPDSGGTVQLTGQVPGGIAAGTQTATSGTVIFSNSNGVTFGMSNNSVITASVVAGGNLNVSAGTTSNNLTNVVFSNSNGVSFGLNGSTITATVQAGAAAGIGAVQAGTQTQTSGTLLFSNLNGVTFGMSNSSVITASVAAGGGTLSLFALGNTTQNSSTSLDARSVSYNALGAMTMGYSNGSIQVSAPPVSSLSATGGLSISTNGSTISIGASQIGTVAAYEINPYMATLTTNFSGNTATSGVASFFPFFLPIYVAGGHINIIQSIAFTTIGTSSGQQSYTQSWALYTRGTGTNSTTLGTITSNSFSIGITVNNSTVTINQPTTSNATGYGTGSTTSAGTNIISNYASMKLVQLHINSTLSPGNYWLGLFNRASTSSVNVGLSVSYMANQRASNLNLLAPIGSASSAFSGGAASGNNGALGAWMEGLGSFSSAAQTNLPVSVALSAISISTSNAATVFPYLRIVGTI